MNERKKRDFIKRIKQEPTIRRKKRLLQKIAYGDDLIEPTKKWSAFLFPDFMLN